VEPAAAVLEIPAGAAAAAGIPTTCSTDCSKLPNRLTVEAGCAEPPADGLAEFTPRFEWLNKLPSGEAAAAVAALAIIDMVFPL
jgi:hypothetical protein